MPAMCVPDVERNVCEPDAVPGYRARWQLRVKLEDLEDGAARHADPADLAPRFLGRLARRQRNRRRDAEERTDAVRRRISDADQRTAEHVPVELHGAIEAGDGDAAVAEGSRSHMSLRSVEVRLADMVRHAQRLCGDRQAWVDGCGRGEERRVDHEQVVDI